MLSLRKYFTLSIMAAGAVIYHAFATRRQFFPATVYLSTSKLAVATVGNLSFAMALCMYNLVIKVFLGTLREIELERVKEKLSSAIMETCFALTIFREEFNMSFVGMFTVLTFVKVFHWLVQDRVDYIEVTPSVSRLAHVRIVSFLLVLLGLDVLFLHETIATTLAQKGHSVQLLFAFEYIILASASVATLLKYILSMVDSAMEGRWDGKGTYVFYLELLTDMLHLFVYCIFFVIVFTNYGLPLHLIRDLYMTFRNFRNRITDFLRFRQVTARMDRFPDASQADLARCDGICIICREEMAAAGLNKKLHCGHVFHLHCLRSWLERQQNCPTCRTSVFRPPQQPAPPHAAAAAPAAAGQPAGLAGTPAAVAANPGASTAGSVGAAAAQDAATAAAPALGAHHAVAPVGAAAASASSTSTAPATASSSAGQQPSNTLRGPVAQRITGSTTARSPRRRDATPSASSSTAAAAAGGAAPHPAATTAHGIPGFWPGGGAAVAPAGLVWQMPQWYPVTSMATFTNAPLQYAGQQSALDQAQAATIAAASMVPMVPAIIPAISAPFPTVMPPVAANATPEQAQAAAAAAAMAAAAAAMYMPPMMPGLAMMPPAMLPAAAAGSAEEQMAAAAAANAAAAAAAAAVMGGAAPPEVMQASFRATQQMLQRQLDYLQFQMNRIRPTEQPPAAAPAAAAGVTSAAEATRVAADGEPPEEEPPRVDDAPSAGPAVADAGVVQHSDAPGSDSSSSIPAADSATAAAADCEPTAGASKTNNQYSTVEAAGIATAVEPASATDGRAGSGADASAPLTAQDSSSPAASAAAGTSEASHAESTLTDGNGGPIASSGLDTDTDELRRRRLQHFDRMGSN